MKPSREQVKRLCERIIERDGNVSLGDFKEIGISDGIFCELCMRGISADQLVKNAKKVIERLEEIENVGA